MRTDFIKVRVHLNRGIKYNAQGYFDQSFKDLLNEEDERFRSRIIIPINESVGLHNWAINFVENPGVGFFVEVFADNREVAGRIFSIASARIEDANLMFWYCGNIDRYLEAD